MASGGLYFSYLQGGELAQCLSIGFEIWRFWVQIKWDQLTVVTVWNTGKTGDIY